MAGCQHPEVKSSWSQSYGVAGLDMHVDMIAWVSSYNDTPCAKSQNDFAVVGFHLFNILLYIKGLKVLYL